MERNFLYTVVPRQVVGVVDGVREGRDYRQREGSVAADFTPLSSHRELVFWLLIV